MKKIQSEGKIETSVDLKVGDVIEDGFGNRFLVRPAYIEQINLRMQSSDEGRNMTCEELLERNRRMQAADVKPCDPWLQQNVYRQSVQGEWAKPPSRIWSAISQFVRSLFG